MVVDAFAKDSKYGTITNDLNEEYDTDYHLDALDFLKLIDSESADCVLYDPPYSLRQVVECYKGVGREVTQETTQSSWRARHLDEIKRILKPGGKALCFGWNSNGVGKKRGFEMQEILLVPHGASKYDTICTCEVKILTPHKHLSESTNCGRRKHEKLSRVQVAVNALHRGRSKGREEGF